MPFRPKADFLRRVGEARASLFDPANGVAGFQPVPRVVLARAVTPMPDAFFPVKMGVQLENETHS